MEHSDLICVKRIKGKGRGVFAKKPITGGTVIERIPVLLVPIKELVNGEENAFLKKYCYYWDDRHVVICLGYGSLYNHSYEPNAKYIHGPNVMTYEALRDIEKGEEITINYNYFPNDKTPMAFDVK